MVRCCGLEQGEARLGMTKEWFEGKEKAEREKIISAIKNIIDD